MSTEQNNIEKRIKENFENHDFEIQDTWLEDMSSKLDDFNEEPKRKFPFWIFLFGGLLLGSAVGAYFYSAADDTSINTTSITELSNAKLVSQEKTTTQISENNNAHWYEEENCDEDYIQENQKTSLNNTNSSMTINNISNSDFSNGNNQIGSVTKAKGAIQNDLNNGVKVNNKTKIPSTNSKAAKNTSLVQNNTAKSAVSVNTNDAAQKLLNQKQNTASFNSNNKKEESKANISSSEKTNSSTSGNLVLTNEILQKSTNSALSKEALVEQLENSKTETKINSSKTENTSLENQQDKAENKTAAIDSLKQAILENDLSEEKEDTLAIKENEKEEDPKSKNKDLGLSLAINAGPSVLFRNFSSTTQNEKRTTEEFNKIAWNANVELYKTFENNIVLGTGIQANNYGEKIAYTSINVSLLDTSYNIVPKDYLNVNVVKSFDTTGQSFYSFDTTAIVYNDSTLVVVDSTYENSSVSKSNSNSQFTYLEIPIMLGYKILDTKKFDIVANTGVSVGFLIHSKGSYITTENELEQAQNTKVNFNYLLNAQFNYQLYKNLNLSLAPNFKYNLNNQSRLVGTKKRYATLGINGGIVLDF